MEPDAGVSPVFVSGCAREAEQLRGLFDRQAGKVAEFDQLADLGLLGNEVHPDCEKVYRHIILSRA